VSLEPFKFIVQPVMIERDEQGVIVGERTTDPERVVVYGCAALAKFASEFEANLGEAESR
jgi:hypothetical protein